jgi:hypothetical protein
MIIPSTRWRVYASPCERRPAPDCGLLMFFPSSSIYPRGSLEGHSRKKLRIRTGRLPMFDDRASLPYGMYPNSWHTLIINHFIKNFQETRTRGISGIGDYSYGNQCAWNSLFSFICILIRNHCRQDTWWTEVLRYSLKEEQTTLGPYGRRRG